METAFPDAYAYLFDVDPRLHVIIFYRWCLVKASGPNADHAEALVKSAAKKGQASYVVLEAYFGRYKPGVENQVFLAKGENGQVGFTQDVLGSTGTKQVERRVGKFEVCANSYCPNRHVAEMEGTQTTLMQCARCRAVKYCSVS